MVFLVPNDLSETVEGKLLDASLGFAAGVMTAASFWSLLAPSIELAQERGYGMWNFFPAAFGFLLGSIFVWLTDILLPDDHPAEKTDIRPGTPALAQMESPLYDNDKLSKYSRNKASSTRRLMLLVIAITVHNFPEGLAVGVGFGAVGSSPKATFQAAQVLTFGIGIQNFPEGLAVSLPMRRMGYSKWWCFFYGQLSGMVEPIGGFIGASAVQFAEPVLPYALAFAAGAMIYVVIDSIVPEGQIRGNGSYTTWGGIVGFLVMMTLDVALG